jgi:hypothetical protein
MTVFINSHTNRQNGNGVYLIELIQNLKIYESKIITLSSNIINKKLEIIKLGFILKKKNNTATKVFEIFLLFFLILKNNQILRNEKIILTSDPPMIGLLLVILKKILNFKLYFWCQDIFPNTLLVSNVIKKNIFFMILTKLNKFILNNCDKIIIISTDMKKTLLYEYQINIEKIKTVQNWPTIKNNFTKKIISKKNYFNFFYIGNIGRMHDESNAMKFLKKINNPNLNIKIFTQSQKILKYKKDSFFKNSIQNCFLTDKNFIDYLNISDIQIIFQNTNSLKYIFPSKLYNILLFQKPILYFLDEGEDEITNLIKKFKIGLRVSKNNFTKHIYLFKNDKFILKIINASREGYRKLNYIRSIRQKSMNEWRSILA